MIVIILTAAIVVLSVYCVIWVISRLKPLPLPLQQIEVQTPRNTQSLEDSLGMFRYWCIPCGGWFYHAGFDPVAICPMCGEAVPLIRKP